MVNDRFPAASIYGFEMVDVATADIRALPSSIENLRRIESFEFSANFREFTSMQTLAIYRRLLIRNERADQPQRNREETTGVARCSFCFAWHSGSGSCSCCCPGKRRRNRTSCRRSAPPRPFGRDRRRLRHGPVLQAPAGGLRGRRPGRDRDRPARQDGARKLYQIITDKPRSDTPDHTELDRRRATPRPPSRTRRRATR